jgi:hypothetical protein
MTFPNTCAIRMSEALGKASSDAIKTFKKSGKNVCKHGYVRGAQDLGAILASSSGFGKRNFGWENPGTAPEAIIGKSGIVCYMNIPGFGGQGHIDLWDKTQAVGEAYWDASPIWMWIL